MYPQNLAFLQRKRFFLGFLPLRGPPHPSPVRALVTPSPQGEGFWHSRHHPIQANIKLRGVRKN